MHKDNGKRNRIGDLSDYKPVFWLMVFWFVVFVGVLTSVELGVF